MRRTKIVCTLGPATDDATILRQLLNGGMNIARLNFSHGSYDEHLTRITMLKELRKEMGIPAALLLDTKGPEIRIRQFGNGSIELKEGDAFTLTTEEVQGNSGIVSITYKDLPRDVKRGDTILIDDGLIELKVVSVKGAAIECEVINGGTVSNNKGVNVPGVTIRLPFVSDRDRSDIIFGIEHDFDFIAASFARTAADIKELRKVLEEHGGADIKIIAKIENRDGVNNIDEILRVSDGVMVARGDMGVEIPFEELPAIQKAIIRKSYIAGKPVITATQMLDSMIRNPRPTRAEITDVANAIYDNTSALMLSGETAIGKHPVEAVITMSKIAVETEKNIDYVKRFRNLNISVQRNVTNAISNATCETAHSLAATAIVTVTKSGHTARMVSKYRPASPIIATTVSEKVWRQLSITWGVTPVLTDLKLTTDEIFDEAIEKAVETGIVKSGDLIVISGGMPAGISGTTNTLKVHVVGDILLKGKGLNTLSATGNLCVVHSESDAMKYFNAGDIL
ncbi:MAG TPA: pyruvate kinase, partial [Spirochaetota bacterium]|nr:pyruvate kinase [Spirochaetota bacterium]